MSVPCETFSVLPVPTLISLVAIVALSIVPLLISVVVKTELLIVMTPVESAIVAEDVPSLALMFVTSRFFESTLVAVSYTHLTLPTIYSV